MSNLLVMDLDGTLVHASHDPEMPHDFVLEFPGERIFVKRRPHLEAFFGAVRPHYDLLVWTSSSKDYGEGVIRGIGLEGVLVGAFFRERCTWHYDPDTGEHVHVKKLSKVRKDLSKVLVIDDSPHKYGRNYGNAVPVRTFEGEPDDRELLDLAAYLVRIKDEPNFRTFEKRGWRATARG